MKHLMARLTLVISVAIGSLFFSLHSGPVHVGWHEIFSFLFGKTVSPDSALVLTALRGPRALATFLVGAGLGTSGLVLQTLLKNPLAEPYTLGLSGGSSLGAVIALNAGFEPAAIWVPCLSTGGCLVATAMVLGFGRRRLEYESRSLILFGVMISLFFGALVVAGLAILSPEKMQSALLWLLGEFGTSRDAWVVFIGPLLVIGMISVFFCARSLDALGLGEARALSLGYSPRVQRALLIFICTLLTALGVSIAGLVGFIGLVSPHIARRILKTSRHDFLVVASAFSGGALLSLADGIGRTVAGTSEIPAGSVAALLGAPILIFLMMSHRYAQVE